MSEKASRSSVQVEIAGERHLIRSEAAPDYTRSVAAHVDATIRNLGGGSGLEPHRAAILAALTITDELFRLREDAGALREEIARRAHRLTDLLEEAASDAADESASARDR